MQRYIVLATLSVAAGAVLGLTKAQAAARGHALEPVKVDKKTGDGTFRVKSAVQFKAGEEILAGAGVISKAQASLVETPEDVAAREEAARKDAAATAAAANELAGLRLLAQAVEQQAPDVVAAIRKTYGELLAAAQGGSQ